MRRLICAIFDDTWIHEMLMQLVDEFDPFAIFFTRYRHKIALGEPDIDHDAYFARLDHIKKQGFEIMPSATTEGMTNLAFPILDPHGRAITVVSCPYLERIDSLSVPDFENVTQLYNNLAAELTEKYGGVIPAQEAL